MPSNAFEGARGVCNTRVSRCWLPCVFARVMWDLRCVWLRRWCGVSTKVMRAQREDDVGLARSWRGSGARVVRVWCEADRESARSWRKACAKLAQSWFRLAHGEIEGMVRRACRFFSCRRRTLCRLSYNDQRKLKDETWLAGVFRARARARMRPCMAFLATSLPARLRPMVSADRFVREPFACALYLRMRLACLREHTWVGAARSP